MITSDYRDGVLGVDKLKPKKGVVCFCCLCCIYLFCGFLEDFLDGKTRNTYIVTAF